MGRLKIGVMLESFRVPVHDALDLAVKVGASGFQMYVTAGELHPSRMSADDRRDFLALVRSKGLEVSALCGDLGHGFTNPATNPDVIAQTKAFLEMSVDLGPRVVTTHIGIVPEDSDDPTWSIMAEALEGLGAYAEQLGAVLATETGPEEPALMRRFLDSLRTTAVRVNYDPANLVMMGFDPVAGVEHLGDLVVHTHAKDGIRHPDGRPEEVPLGHGQVPFARYVAALEAKGYRGYYTIEREVGDSPFEDIAEAARFLASL